MFARATSSATGQTAVVGSSPNSLKGGSALVRAAVVGIGSQAFLSRDSALFQVE